MTNIITLYCNKGGVSKTTTTFNLGWKLAEMGKKVILIDADAQCNLTGMMLQFNDVADVGDFYTRKGNTDIYSEVEGYVMGNSADVGLKCMKVDSCNNLHLVPGSIDLSRIESQIAFVIKTGDAFPRMAQLPGLYPKLIRELAITEEADFVLIDTAPSLSALNQCLLMGSDYFIVPTYPDYYSGQAILSLSRVFPGWVKDTNQFRNGQTTEAVGKYKFLSKMPQFLGYVVQNYNIRHGEATAANSKWIDKIGEAVRNVFVPMLSKNGMCAQPAEDFLLAKFSDFNTLMAISQEFAKPVYTLTDEELKTAKQYGVILEKQQEKVTHFNQEFEEFAAKIVAKTRPS